MKVISYISETGPRYGILDPDNQIFQVKGSLEKGFQKCSRVSALEDVRLLPPVHPTKIVAVGRNYVAHIKEFNRDIPTEPILFLKPPSALIAYGDVIRIPEESRQVQHEAELAVVVGKRGRRLSEEEALSIVFGYTCANDVTARDLQYADAQWTRGKGFDTFCPLGPWIETEYDPYNKTIECKVNGNIRQKNHTGNMIFTIPTLIRYISHIMTLEPGDLILTGTPEGVDDLHSGDVVEVQIEDLGILRNLVE
jgi:2-keto-4-pentenoate hydratase/2-oxohepta-3-ene-1,7-dioic acid hydratase in catechol pathway